MTFFEIATLGCKVNQYESAQIAAKLKINGWQQAGENPANLIIINTCLVTNIAERKSRQLIRKLIKQYPQAKIIILGCYSNIKKDSLAKLFPQAKIILQKDKTDISSWGINLQNNQLSTPAAISQSRLRQTLKIQDGCNQYCSYCIIAYARGKLVSKPAEDIFAEAQAMINNQVKEIVLTGINIGKYQTASHSLEDVLEQLSQLDFERIRISSIEPNLVNDRLIELIVSKKNIMPHLHLPLQSGSDQILQLMNRPYTSAQYQKLAQCLKKNNISITTDLIIGFPGETAQTFQASLDLLQVCGIYDVHVFKYSARPGTKAFTMAGKLSGNQIEELLQKALVLKENLRANYPLPTKKYSVLFEQKKSGLWQGLSQEYIRFFVQSEQQLKGLVKEVTFSNYQNQKTFGQLID